MVKVYPAFLEPLKALNSGLEKVSSSGISCYAIVSDEEILIRENSPLGLGKKYHENYKERLKRSDSEVDVLSYNFSNKIIHTKDGIFRVKELASLHIRDFERGMLEALNRNKG